MYKLCVFGGTTEGRELVEFLNTQPCRVTACVATEYGQTLLPEGENLTVSARPLPVGEIGALLQAERFDLVIDATHPYAVSITKSIAAACEAAGVEHWRLLRGASEAPEDAVFAENTDEAVRFLSGTEGNILLTTGSKELSKFAALPDFAVRCWARVLPLPASLEACSAAGLSPSHIFALQGPFSREMDEAMLHRTGARWLVTKDGGAAGGFQEKAAAARHAGARLLVIGRPAQETGSSLPETIGALCARFGFSCRPQVTIVGIGPGSEAADAILEYLHVSYQVIGEANLPSPDGRYIFVSNHPLGGPDGIILISFLGTRYPELKFPVNDLLLNLKNLNNIFLPVNKHGAQAKDAVSALEDAYASDCQMIMFPAGLVSRKQQGIIQDLEWQKSFVSKAIQHRRDIVPIFIDGRNSNFFYNLANFRKKIGLKANIEMLYLPDETFKQRNRTFTLYIGQPIEWESLDKSKKPIEWAQEIKRKVYLLKEGR